MQYLQAKSKINSESAEFLIDKGLFAPSIHCSYYSVFQLLFCKCVSLSGEDFDSFKSASEASGRGSHNHAIDNFFGNSIIHSLIIKIFTDARKPRELKNKIKALKELRTRSDYDDVEIDDDTSKRAFQESVEIIRQLEKIKDD